MCVTTFPSSKPSGAVMLMVQKPPVYLAKPFAISVRNCGAKSRELNLEVSTSRNNSAISHSLPGVVFGGVLPHRSLLPCLQVTTVNLQGHRPIMLTFLLSKQSPLLLKHVIPHLNRLDIRCCREAFITDLLYLLFVFTAVDINCFCFAGFRNCNVSYVLKDAKLLLCSLCLPGESIAKELADPLSTT
jgi:hypothetical protein